MNRTRVGLSVVLISIAVVATGVWLRAQTEPVIGTLGTIAANPAYIVVNRPTPVLFTAEITDPRLKKRSVVLVRLDEAGQPFDILGRLRDDGKDGDVLANDHIYSFRVSLKETTVGTVNFKIAARFKSGEWTEPEADDDDWDVELATTPATGRDQPAEGATKTKRLKKLVRYVLSSQAPVNSWAETSVQSVEVLVPPTWSVISGPDAAVLRPPSVSESVAITVRQYSVSPAISLDQWLVDVFGDTLLLSSVSRGVFITSKGYRVVQLHGLPDESGDNAMSFVKTGDIVCQLGASPFTTLASYYSGLLDSLSCGN